MLTLTNSSSPDRDHTMYFKISMISPSPDTKVPQYGIFTLNLSLISGSSFLYVAISNIQQYTGRGVSPPMTSTMATTPSSNLWITKKEHSSNAANAGNIPTTSKRIKDKNPIKLVVYSPDRAHLTPSHCRWISLLLSTSIFKIILTNGTPPQPSTTCTTIRNRTIKPGHSMHLGGE